MAAAKPIALNPKLNPTLFSTALNNLKRGSLAGEEKADLHKWCFRILSVLALTEEASSKLRIGTFQEWQRRVNYSKEHGKVNEEELNAIESCEGETLLDRHVLDAIENHRVSLALFLVQWLLALPAQFGLSAEAVQSICTELSKNPHVQAQLNSLELQVQAEVEACDRIDRVFSSVLGEQVDEPAKAAKSAGSAKSAKSAKSAGSAGSAKAVRVVAKKNKKKRTKGKKRG
jgi:hypothetical protein